MKMKTKTPQKKVQNLANTSVMQKAKNTPMNKKNITTVAVNMPQALKNAGTPKQIQNGAKNVRNGAPILIPIGTAAKNGKGKQQAKPVVQVAEESSEEEDEFPEDDDSTEEDESSEENDEGHFVAQQEVEEEDDDDDEEDENDDDEENVENERSMVTVSGNLGDEEVEENDDDDEDDDDEEDDEEEEEANKTQAVIAKQTKAAVQSDEEEEEDDEDEDEEEEDATTAKKSKVVEESDEEEDEAPAVAPIKKAAEEPAEGTNEKAKFTDDLPEKFPQENTIYIKNGLEKLKIMKLFNLFKIFGNIVNMHKSEEEWSVTFATKDSAVLALLFYPQLPLKNDEPLTTSSKVFTAEQLQKLEAKTVIIRYFMQLQDVRTAFSACGKIAYLGVVPQKNILKSRNIAIVFETAAAAKKALQMHNSIVNGRNILLTSKKNAQIKYNSDRTIRVLNTAKHENFNVDTLLTIFGDCGEIEHIDVLCSNSLLAVIIFKDAEGFKKAYELQGQTVDDFYILLESDSKDAKESVVAPKKTQIYVSNIKPGTSEEELRALFEGTVGEGSIKSFQLKNGFGFIDFQTVEQFCKSFTLDESVVNGQRIYLQPYAMHKRKRNDGFDSRKRGPPADNDDGNGPPKRRFNGPPNGRGGGNFNRGNQRTSSDNQNAAGGGPQRFFNDNQNGGGKSRFNRNEQQRPNFYRNPQQNPRFNNFNSQSGQGPPRQFNKKPFASARTLE